MDCLFSLGSNVGSNGAGFPLKSWLPNLPQKAFLLPATASTKPSHLLNKPRTLSLQDPAQSAPFPLQPWARSSLWPPLSSQLFCSFQWCLGVQQPENLTALASLQAWGPLNQGDSSCLEPQTVLPHPWSGVLGLP